MPQKSRELQQKEAGDRAAKEAYKTMVEQASPNSKLGSGCLKAFIVGGLICVLGQAIHDIGMAIWNFDTDVASIFDAVVLVFLGATLTGIGVYDKIGKFAGAGSIIPITGFANSMVAPAMEFKREGYVLGVGAKMFTLAGPVLVFGVTSSVVAGLIYFFFGG